MEVSRDAYHLAASAMQKAIRRGHVRLAVVAARVVFRHKPWSLWRRLWTIACEDCCRDWRLLEYMSRLPGQKAYEDECLMLGLVAEMANAVKSSETLSFMYPWWGGRKDLIPADVLAVMERVEAKDYCDQWPEWLRMFLARARPQTDHHLPLPAIWKATGGKMPAACELIDTAMQGLDPDTTDEEGLLLLSALDEHCRSGRIVLGTFRKQLQRPELTSKALSWLQWYAVSNRKRRCAPDVLEGGEVEWKWALTEVRALADETVWTVFRENFPRLQDLQRWALKKLVGADVLDAFREAAE